jgi:hypothetical protein
MKMAKQNNFESMVKKGTSGNPGLSSKWAKTEAVKAKAAEAEAEAKVAEEAKKKTNRRSGSAGGIAQAGNAVQAVGAVVGGLMGSGGGSANRRYSFKKLYKRNRGNKTNKAKQNKRLIRSKKMRR